MSMKNAEGGWKREEVWVKREIAQPTERGIEKRKKELRGWGKSYHLL